jgi:hypothetical protein
MFFYGIRIFKISEATSLFSMEVSHLQPKRYLPKFLVFLDRLDILMSNIFFKKYYFDVFTSKKYVKIQSILEYQRSSDAKISKATSLFLMEVSHLQPK